MTGSSEVLQFPFKQEGDGNQKRNLQSVYKTESFRDYMNSTNEVNPEEAYRNKSNLKVRPRTESFENRLIQDPKRNKINKNNSNFGFTIY